MRHNGTDRLSRSHVSLCQVTPASAARALGRSLRLTRLSPTPWHRSLRRQFRSRSRRRCLQLIVVVDAEGGVLHARLPHRHRRLLSSGNVPRVFVPGVGGVNAVLETLWVEINWSTWSSHRRWRTIRLYWRFPRDRLAGPLRHTASYRRSEMALMAAVRRGFVTKLEADDCWFDSF